MLRKLIKPILVFPICLYINSQKALLSETKNNIEDIHISKSNLEDVFLKLTGRSLND